MSGPAPETTALLKEILALPGADRLARLRREPDPAGVLLALGDEAERLVVSDLSRALVSAQGVLALADGHGDAVPRCRARRALAQALAYANRFDEAIASLRDAAQIAGAGVPLEAARIDLASLHALARLGRFDEALEAGERARSAFLAGGERTLSGRADVNMGVVRRMRDDPAGALMHFDRARPQLLDQPMILAQLDSNRAEALLDLNRFADAEAAFQSALGFFESTGAVRAAAIVTGNLADLMSRQGRLDRAIQYFERARRGLGGQAPGDQARLAAEQADALAAISIHDEAAHLYEQALPVLHQSGLAAEAARARAGLGRVLVRLGRADDAARSLEHAVAEFRALGHETGAARAQATRAELAAARGDRGAARDLLRESLRTLATRPADAAVAHLLLADLALRAGDVPAAEAGADAALDAAGALDLAPLLADALSLRARVRRAQSRWADSSDDLRRALEQVERIRGTLHADRFRAAFLGGRTDVYEACFSDALDRGDPAGRREAFHIAELAKSRTLLDLLNGGLALGTGSPELASLEPLSRKRAELNALYRGMDDVAARGRGGSHAGVNDRIRATEHAIDAMEAQLAGTARFAAVFAEPMDAESVLSGLPDSSAVLEFFQENGRFTALVLARGQVRTFRGLITAAEARDLAERVHFQVGRAFARGLPSSTAGARLIDDIRRELGRLDEALLAPVRAGLDGIEDVSVAPHGVLHAVPFHALWSADGYWIERCRIRYVPSTSVLQRLRLGFPPSAHAAARSRAVLVGTPRDDLPAIRSEIEQLRSVCPRPDVLLGPTATRAEFASRATEADLLHVASHARFDLPDPLSSGFELADGWFTVRDAYGLRLPGSTVVLSGCDTGRAMVRAGDELVGLAHAFLSSGARSLVVSQWAAHDRTAAELIAATYRRWYADPTGNSVSIGAALRSAQREAMRAHPHPAAWAGFFAIGDV